MPGEFDIVGMMAKRCTDILLAPRPRKTMRIDINSCRSRFLLPYIPDEVMFDVLLRLPSKSLMRFKSVCKAWHAMISSPIFINAHLEWSKLKPSSLLMAPGFYQKQKNGIGYMDSPCALRWFAPCFQHEQKNDYLQPINKRDCFPAKREP